MNIVTKSAKLLKTGEYDVFMKARLHAHIKMCDDEIHDVYYHYIHTEQVPTWVQTYCENLLEKNREKTGLFKKPSKL